jgi:hypothetical protein
MVRHHIVPDGDEWAVKKDDAERASRKADTKKEAKELGKEIAKNQNSELKIHREDGEIQEGRSYGNDPFPPEG